jgi:hypothetical protein
MGNYEDMEEEGFWFEIQEVSLAIQELIRKYGMEDRVISAVVVGLLEPVSEDQSNMKAFFNYNMQSKDELGIITDFMKDSYTPPDDGLDLDDHLDGLGISLN